MNRRQRALARRPRIRTRRERAAPTAIQRATRYPRLPHGARSRPDPRSARAQPALDRRRDPEEEARRVHGRLGLGQVVARVRHALRRGPAPLRRVALGLRAPVPRPDGEAAATTRIRGLSPTISIEQKTAGTNPRSTVGTITEIYDYLRVLYARVGVQHCHVLRRAGRAARPPSRSSRELARLPEGTRLVAARAARSRTARASTASCSRRRARAGFVRLRVDGEIVRERGARRRSTRSRSTPSRSSSTASSSKPDAERRA